MSTEKVNQDPEVAAPVAEEKHTKEVASSTQGSQEEIDIYSYHEHNAGRLIIDPAEAKIELGEAITSKLKLSEDGTKILWPQPTDSPRDPQNWTNRRKAINLLVITLAAIVPDFDSGIGIASIFALAGQYDTTPGVINNLTSNWSIFLLGWGGLAAVMLIRRLGRLPILFWSQVFALAFLIGCTFAPNLKTFTAMRCLNGFFATAPQVTGLFTVTDMYPFHLQARKLNLWTMGYLVSPFLSPFLFGFLVAKTTWRWAYGIGCIYSLIVVLLIVFFAEETAYDRTLHPIPEAETTGLRYRIETLLGITGVKMQKHRISWMQSILTPFELVWRPHLISLLLFEAVLFGYSIGINVTLAVFLGTPVVAGGYGFSQNSIAGSYATPIVAVVLGEVAGRFINDFIMNASIRRNKGVFEAESRLWACYISLPIYVTGMVVIGAALQKHLSIGALIMGWGLTEFATMTNTVAVFAYFNDSFPKHPGEISALINLARVLGGFAVAYYQVPWATAHGAMQTFGVEAAIVAGLFLLFVPFVQFKGRSLREKFSLH